MTFDIFDLLGAVALALFIGWVCRDYARLHDDERS